MSELAEKYPKGMQTISQYFILPNLAEWWRINKDVAIQVSMNAIIPDKTYPK